MRITLVFLKMSDVLSLNTLSSFGSLSGSAIGPVCRQAIAKRDGSSATPSDPLTPPVRAWLMWHDTPDTRGSSNAHHADLVVGAEDPKRRRRAADVVGRGFRRKRAQDEQQAGETHDDSLRRS